MHYQDNQDAHRFLLHFAHGTDPAGLEGILTSRYLAPASVADGMEAVGHYCQATPWPDNASQLQALDKVVGSGKFGCPGIVMGYASLPGPHYVLKSGGGLEAQQACLLHAGVHFKSEGKWVLHSDRSSVTAIALAVRKHFLPLRDSRGRPIFQVAPTHAQQVQQNMSS